MIKTLKLTQAEKETFDSLPATLREGWTVEEETQTSYEPPEVLAIRAHISKLGDVPSIKAMLDRVKAGQPLDGLSLDSIPESSLADFFFTIGARGLSWLIANFLLSVKDDSDIEGIAGLTLIRTELLANNASISYA